jgi:hypothetical protein
MKYILMIMGILLNVGCASIEQFNHPASVLRGQWTYNNENRIADHYYIRERTLTGNCMDYALTLQKQIGGDIYYIPFGEMRRIFRLENWGTDAHAVLCKDGRCYDQIRSYSREFLESNVRGWFVMSYYWVIDESTGARWRVVY